MHDLDDPRPPLPPPRFSLRTLFLGVTACGLFCGAFWWFPPSVVAGGALAGLMVAAHVLGNSMGTQLRDRAPPRPALTPQQADEAAAGRAPATHLGGRDSLGWIMLLPTGAGALLAMIGGCWWIEATYHLGFDLGGLAIAALAFGVLGGLATFALATFSQVLAVALWQAMRHK